MAAALSLMIIVTISFTIVRIAAVAMRLTGMPDGQARFQALSALTGTGFTTSEAEMIVNYPLRRKIVSSLMIIGNLGLISFVSALMISFMRTDAQLGSVLEQIVWIVVGIGFLFLLMTNEAVDKALCATISRVLQRFTRIGRRRFVRLLQLGDGLSIVEHHVGFEDKKTLGELLEPYSSLKLLLVIDGEGKAHADVQLSQFCTRGDAIILFGRDEEQMSLTQTYEHAAERVDAKDAK